MKAKVFVEALTALGYKFFSGVPDSTFGSLFWELENNREIRYLRAVREDVALGAVSAAHLSGSKGAVVLQNSGLGNLVNPLTSFSLMYRIPALLIVGWRGHGGPPNDAPEHWIMGEKSASFFEFFNIPYRILELEAFEETVHDLVEETVERSIPGALLVRSKMIG